MNTPINIRNAKSQLRRSKIMLTAGGVIGECACMYGAICAPVIRAIKIAPGVQHLTVPNVLLTLISGVAMYYIDCKWADNAQKINKKINQLKSIRNAKGYERNGR